MWDSPISTAGCKLPGTADRELLISACGDFIYSNSPPGSSPALVCRFDSAPRGHVFLFKHFCCVVRFWNQFSLRVEFTAHITQTLLDWLHVSEETPELSNVRGKIIQNHDLQKNNENQRRPRFENSCYISGSWVCVTLCRCVCVCLTLIKLFLDVVLVRLVPADAIQAFCRQTCEHKQASAQKQLRLELTQKLLNSKSRADRSCVIGFR